MRISVVCKGNPISEGFREYFSHRANLALDRYRPEIHSVRACLEDTSNPLAGPIQSCRVEVHGEFGKRFIAVHDQNFKAAIDCALGVSASVVERALARADSEMFGMASRYKWAS
jgi:ribosome-associated translation inhibitor RaiA